MSAIQTLVAMEVHVLMEWLASRVCVFQATLVCTVKKVSLSMFSFLTSLKGMSPSYLISVLSSGKTKTLLLQAFFFFNCVVRLETKVVTQLNP